MKIVKDRMIIVIRISEYEEVQNLDLVWEIKFEEILKSTEEHLIH